MPFIEFSDVSFKYPEETDLALCNVNLSIEKGEFVSIVGANSSGKTTLGRLMNALLIPTNGKVIVDSLDTLDTNNIIPVRKRVGMIFQNPDNQIVATTVEEEVAFGPENLGIEPNEIRKRVEESLKSVGMYELRDRQPHLLSGGQKQRTACARALVTNPKLILADEPTGALDSKSAQMLIEMMANLNKDLGATILMVTHDSFTASYCNRILFIKDGKIFTELVRGENTRRQFFNKILDVVALLGGDVRDVR